MPPAMQVRVEDFYPAKKRLRETARFLQPTRKSLGSWCQERATLDSCAVLDQAEAIAEETVRDKFLRLAEEWSEATRNVSSLTAMATHPKYREIIGLGWEVVPFLLADLQRSNRFWFPALTEITKIRPYDPRDVGNSRRMIDSWIRWGKKKNLI